MGDPEKRGAKIIALCGKGGVGKTSLSASIVKILAANPENKVLAIDAEDFFDLLSNNIEIVKSLFRILMGDRSSFATM